MKALIQVVEEAEVSIEGNSVGSIDNGALVFLGIKEGWGRPGERTGG